ncbi:MAG: hypothetical protein V1779_00055 [bacterium]
MKLFINLTFLTILSFFVFSCKQTNDTPVNPVSEVMANFGDCLENEVMAVEGDTSKTIIEYSFSNNVLTIKHLSAGFNCCFDYILVVIEVKDNVIFIKEKDIKPNCYCLCLRDIYYNIDGISPSQYQVKIIEPYLPENDTAIIFDVDLKEGADGTVGFSRTSYPWTL